jgi:hypothetical protein
LQRLGRLQEALADYADSIRLYEELVQHRGRHELHNDLARAYMNRGATVGRLPEALADYAACIALLESNWAACRRHWPITPPALACAKS